MVDFEFCCLYFHCTKRIVVVDRKSTVKFELVVVASTLINSPRSKFTSALKSFVFRGVIGWHDFEQLAATFNFNGAGASFHGARNLFRASHSAEQYSKYKKTFSIWSPFGCWGELRAAGIRGLRDVDAVHFPPVPCRHCPLCYFPLRWCEMYHRDNTGARFFTCLFRTSTLQTLNFAVSCIGGTGEVRMICVRNVGEISRH